MRSHAKASPAGSTQAQGSRSGLFIRGVGATRGFSHSANGSGAPSRGRVGIAALSFAAALLVLALFASSAFASKELISDFGSLAESGSYGGELNNPRDVAINESGVGPANAGDAYVADENNNRIERFDKNGNFVSAWGKDTIASTINERQRIVLNEASAGTYTLTFEGATTAPIPFNYSAGDLWFTFLAPLPTIGGYANIAVSGRGTAANPFIVTFTGTLAGANQPTITADTSELSGTVSISTIVNGTSTVPDDTGTGFEICTVATECKTGSASGENGALDHPQSVAVDQDTGNVYVSDRGNRRIDEFDGEGNFIRSFGFDVAESGPGDIGTGYEVCNEAESDACKAGVGGSGVGQYGEGFAENGFGIAVSPPDASASTGTVYLADSGNRRVDTFDLDGTSPSSFGSAAQFGEEQPRSVAVDSRGIVYASNSNNGGDIQRYDSEDANGGGVGFLAPIVPPANEVQEITFTGFNEGDAFTLTCPNGEPTGELTYSTGFNFEIGSIGLAVIKNGLEEACGGGNFSFSGEPPNVTVAFKGALAAVNQPQMTCTVLSGTGSCSISTASEGRSGPLLSGEASSATAGLAVNSAGTTLYVLRSGRVQQLGPTNEPGLNAPPAAIDDTHGAAGGFPSVRGFGFDGTSGRLYVSATGDPDGFEGPLAAGHRVYVIADSSALPNPTAEMPFFGPVTAIADRSATFHGSVDPKGGLIACKFQYSNDEVNWTDVGYAEGIGDVAYGSKTITHVKTTSGVFVAGERISGEGLGGFGSPVIVAVGAETLTLSVPASGNVTNVALSAKPAFPPRCEALNLNGGPQSVTQQVLGLVPGQKYFVRLQVTRPYFSSFTPVTSTELRSFTTATGSPVLSDPTAKAVDEHSVRVSASIDPGHSPTSYVVQYGTTPSLGSSTAPVQIGAGSSPIEVASVVTGLSPATQYYFKLIATNLAGPTASKGLAAGTFSSSPSFGSCANARFRTGPSAKLPDCRAYEQATPTDKYGSDAYGSTYSVQASSAGDGITSYTFSGFPGGESFQNANVFLSRFVGGEWSTAGLNPPSSYGDSGVVLASTSDLRLSFAADVSLTAEGIGLVVRDNADGSSTPLIPPDVGFTSEGNGFALAGAFDNDSKVVFHARGNVPVTSGPAPLSVARNVYLYDRDTGELTLAGLLPDSACASPPCVPSGGSEVQGAFQSYVQDGHVVSPSGDIYFTDVGTGRLYLRRDAASPSASTVYVAASHKTEGGGPGGVATNSPQPARFQGATADGSKAFFTSPEELTNDANTGPEPVLPPLAIGRANITDGSGKQASFIPTTAKWTAVDSGHVYWTNTEAGTIGRAGIGGNSPDPSFITGLENPEGIAVDSGHLYWAEARNRQAGTGTIGRAELDGSGNLVPGSIEKNFVTGTGDPHGVAVSPQSASPRYVYWTNGTSTDIGRAEVSGASPEQSFLTRGGGEHPWGIAVNATNLYWIDQEGNAYIIKMNVGGGGESYENVGGQARGIAVDSNHIYWADVSNGRIGRRELNFANANAGFITGVEGIFGVATDAGHIYWATSPPEDLPPSPGNDLYRYDAGSGELIDVAPDSSDPNGSKVVGMLGYSDDGNYAYFAANGDLDGGGPATSGDCAGKVDGIFNSFAGSCSVYLWQADGAGACASAGGCVTFVTRIEAGGEVESVSDGYNWAGGGSDESDVKTSRVSADGRILVFRSQRQLTAYDNTPAPGACFGVNCSEFYRYDAESGQIICLTCNPTGAPPTGAPDLKNPDMWHAPTSAAYYNAQLFLSRNLSPDGNRFFFQSTEKLVPADVNGEAKCSEKEIAQLGAGPSCRDVYEWEAPGTPGGSCTKGGTAYSSANGGCIYLLSTGTGAYPSYLADVSESGDTAFIFSRQQLVPIDEDTQEDIYAVKVNGGLASQNAARPAACEGDACRGASSQPSDAPGAGSAVFEGPGNPKSGTNNTRCPKGKREVHAKGKVRCVAKKHGHKTQKRHHRRATNNDRRASR